MASISVRPATMDDVDFLGHVLYATNFQHTPHDAESEADWVPGAVAAATDQVLGKVPDSITYVIEADGERIGRLRVVRTSERIEIAGIQILPERQSRGAGSCVIADVMREADRRGVCTELQVSVKNHDAERLYTRLGFRRRARDGDDWWMTAAPH